MKKNLKYIVSALILVFFSVMFFIIDIISENYHAKEEIKKKDKIIASLEKRVKTLSNELEKAKLKNLTNEYLHNLPSEIEDYTTAIKNQPINNKTSIKLKKPKLVIILDDVAFAYQVKEIKNLPFKITPSFFPPTKIHPNTPKYAKKFKDYIVHVPMQALHFSHPEPDTIDINYSYNQIKTRIENIKKWFPNAKFINNHTGSKFTANLKEMEYLFKILKEENLGFVDSKTTPFSKAKTAEKIYHIPFFERNIFLDNKQNISYIQNQLKKAVKLAKEKGYAIAIGHPHKATIEALKNSKDILKDVDIISINELYKLKEENGN